jgi:polyisoprenoid-binding protein YceI
MLSAVAGALLVRQIVFGGTPILHGGSNAAATTPCTSGRLPAGFAPFALEESHSSASYTAHFLAAGQSIPGTVVGETSAVSGEFLLATTPTATLQSLNITVDLRTLDSGSSERDQHVRDDTFDTAKYPYAVFTVARSPVVSGTYRDGQNVKFSLEGQLTLHGITRPVTFAMQVRKQASSITGLGSTVIQLQTFGMKDPQLTSIVPVTIGKDIILMIQFTAVEEACFHAD